VREQAAGAVGTPVNEPLLDVNTLHATICCMALENNFALGLFLQARQTPSLLQNSLVDVLTLFVT
jgi:hypothetical protein